MQEKNQGHRTQGFWIYQLLSAAHQPSPINFCPPALKQTPKVLPTAPFLLRRQNQKGEDTWRRRGWGMGKKESWVSKHRCLSRCPCFLCTSEESIAQRSILSCLGHTVKPAPTPGLTWVFCPYHAGRPLYQGVLSFFWGFYSVLPTSACPGPFLFPGESLLVTVSVISHLAGLSSALVHQA
jgi:hypothetical protein